MKRSSGILMPVSALPSPYGIGSLGKCARDFVDFLSAAGQTWWQMLPVGMTSIGDSPYQSPSAYAGNPYFIDLDLLREEGLLTKEEISGSAKNGDPVAVDYGTLYETRLPLLAKACERMRTTRESEVLSFADGNQIWLPDHALFMALKKHYGMQAFTDWPKEGLRLHRLEALEAVKEELEDDIWLFTCLQYFFFRQWDALHAYAKERGVRIMGDIALYVALDSSDVWADPENFLLDERRLPSMVAGVPPDQFTEEGQLWGNPLYDYAYMKKDGFSWWLHRIGGAARLFDAIRIDHFRGIESFWAVPAGENTAKNGRWVKGPGMDLVGKIKEQFPATQFIAEDLGYPTPEVERLLRDSGFPGMKVLEFVFDARDEEGSLPHTFPENSVCYTGTHDNETLKGWLADAAPEDVAMARTYFGLNREEGYIKGMLRGGMSSPSVLFIAQMQDYLELGKEARMNIPGTKEGNWRWRMLPGQASRELAEKIHRMTALYGRI